MITDLEKIPPAGRVDDQISLVISRIPPFITSKTRQPRLETESQNWYELSYPFGTGSPRRV